MEIKNLIRTWFDRWEKGDFLNLPLTENFRHSSPYGTVEGRQQYFDIVEPNKEQFLGNRFIQRDAMYEQNKACVRYTMVSKDFEMEVSEWFYTDNGLIREIVSYYNIGGEISEERKLNQ